MDFMRTLILQLCVSSFILFQSFFSGASDLKTVENVQLDRYMGDWNVIANIPNWIEKDCISSIESYALRSDGMIDNWFVCHKSDGTETKLSSLAWVKNTATHAEWRIRFNWDTFLGKIPVPFHFSYFIIDLDSENYTYTVVGHPNRSLLWIMSRNPILDEKIYQEILIQVAKQGFDISKIVKLPQFK